MPLSTASALLLVPLGCCCSAAGLLLMKSSTEYHPSLPPWRSWRWLCGFFCLGILATTVEVIALGTLPLSVVAPFAGLTIVFSLLLAATGSVTRPERLRRADAVSVALVLAGVTGATAGSRPRPSPASE